MPLAAIILLSGSTAWVQAATFTVNNSGDAADAVPGNGICETAAGNGICTLRAAVGEANVLASDDTINFAQNITTVTLVNAEIQIDSPQGSLTITGRGADFQTIDGGAGLNRIFYINNAFITISGLTLTGGNGVGAINRYGGAIYIVGGSLSLNSVSVKNNGAANVFFGGGIYYNGGTNHRIANSTFSGNTAAQCGGFFFRIGNLTMVNSTISSNTASEFDLGVGGLCNDGTMTIRNSTITNNSATAVPSAGGGVYNNSIMSIGNTIIAGNSAPSQPEIYNSSAGAINSDGNNLIGDSAGDSADTFTPIVYEPSDIRDMPPQLGPLTVSNGGTTATHALLTGSPAIDKGFNSLATGAGLTTDQRGFPRFVDGDRDATITVDIGAYEFAAVGPTAAGVTVSGRVTTASGRGIGGVSITLTDSAGVSRSAFSTTFGFYHFDDVPAGETYIIGISAKRYKFSQPTHLLNITGESDAVNFVADSF